MKTLKMNLEIFSLLAILTISMVFISCEQEDIVPSIEETFATELRNGQDIEYDQLSEQEKADLARFLGWIWGDGKPTDAGSGAKFTSNHPKYDATINRLAAITIDGDSNPFNFRESGNLKLLPDIWDYWNNALPGGNPDDPQLLKDAIRNPNFLAGLIDGEGQVVHSPGKIYYIDDQTYFPSHPTKTLYGGLYFGPERINQLFSLLGETYGFANTEMRFSGKRFTYATQHCEAMEALREKYQQVKANNENPANEPKGFTVKVYIDAADFATLRSYGYFPRSNYRTPAPDDDGTLNILSGNLPDILPEVQGTMSFFGGSGSGLHIINTETNEYLNSDLELVPFVDGKSTSWELVDLGNDYFRVVSLDDSKTKRWLQALEDKVVRLTGENSTGHKTQWRQVTLSNGSYLLKNRFSDKFLRLGTDSVIKHGAGGTRAHWTLEGASTCTP